MAEDFAVVANGSLFSPRLELLLRLIVDCLLDGSELSMSLGSFSAELYPGREAEVCSFLEQRANVVGTSRHHVAGPISITQLDAHALPAMPFAGSTFALCATINTQVATTTFLLGPAVGLQRVATQI